MTDMDKGPWTDPNDETFSVASEGEIDRKAELLEEMPIPGNPKQEQERKAKWLALPRRARIAIRRLHRNMRHLPKAAIIQILRIDKAPKDYLAAARAFRCGTCDLEQPKLQTHKVGKPPPYTFNHEVGVDVVDVKDVNGKFFNLLSTVCVCWYSMAASLDRTIRRNAWTTFFAKMSGRVPQRLGSMGWLARSNAIRPWTTQ